MSTARDEYWHTRPTRPLPRTVAPVPDETVASYLDRLARANRLDATALRRWLRAPGHRQPPTPALLSLVSGYPEVALCHAMPELCPVEARHTLHIAGRPRPGGAGTGPGCACCNAARGAEAPVLRWCTHEDVVCWVHRRWIATANHVLAQPDLRRQPQILRAHRAHRRLIRVAGRETVHAAYRAAGKILERWRDGGSDYDDGFVERMRIFHAARHAVTAGDPTVQAAAYPQRVALTRLLAHPYWRALALEEHRAAGRPDRARMRAATATIPPHTRTETQLWDGPDPANQRIREAFLLPGAPGIDRFAAEVRATVDPYYRWYPLPLGRGRFEPLVQWVLDELTTTAPFHDPADEEAFPPCPTSALRR